MCFELVMTIKICFQHYSGCNLTYGENCQYPCNRHCVNQTCDRINGSCLYGCKYGKQCTEGILIDFDM